MAAMFTYKTNLLFFVQIAYLVKDQKKTLETFLSVILRLKLKAVMSPPKVRVNTFVTKKEKLHIDPISKMFIVSEAIMGFDRLPVIRRGKYIYVFVTFITHLIWTVLIVYACFIDDQPMTVMVWNKIEQNSICALLSYTRCNWMLSYYFKLNTFDREAACKLKVSASSIRNAMLTGLTIICLLALFAIYSSLTNTKINLSVQFLPLHVVYILEVYYFGHLLSLLVSRLKLINYYIESSLSGAKLKPHPTLKEFVYIKHCNASPGQCHMDKLMDIYEVVVQAYDCLVEGIKWQLLVIIVSGFTSSLGFLYVFWLDVIRYGEMLAQNAVMHVGMTTVLMAPLFSPCTFANYVHSEVRKLRELISSKLYENKLDKSGRSTARAFLAYAETRDLSFRLLRILSINISLPFKFLALLLTYLIILLQFEKVVLP